MVGIASSTAFMTPPIVITSPRWMTVLLNTGISCILAGKWFFKMNPVILLGACTGARLCTAALGALQEACGSSTPVLGYTIPYALNNVIFAVWGVVIVLLMA